MMAQNLSILQTKSKESHVYLSFFKTSINGSISSSSYLLRIGVEVGVLCHSQTIKTASSFELRKGCATMVFLMIDFFYSNIVIPTSSKKQLIEGNEYLTNLKYKIY